MSDISLAVNKSFSKAQQFSGISLSTFLASISTSLAIFGAQCLLFITLRHRIPHLYPQTTNKTTRWREMVSELIDFEWSPHSHMDVYFFRRYIRTLIMIFLPLCCIVTPILIPINYLHGKGAVHGVQGLDKLGWANVGLDYYDRYWSHLVLTFALVGIVCTIIWSELAEYVRIRHQSYLSSLRTILVDGIPQIWSTSQELAAQFEHFPGGVDMISFNRDYKQLSQLLQQRETLVRTLEAAETRLIKTKAKEIWRKKEDHRPTWRVWVYELQNSLDPILDKMRSWDVSAIPSYRESIRRLSQEIEAIRDQPQNFRQLPSAFVTFEDPVAARIACQTVIHGKPGYMTPRLLPLSPEDVIWSNISIGWWSRALRAALSNTLIGLLALVCVIPVSFAGLLSQVIYLTYAISWLNWLNNVPEWALSVLQGLIPPLILAILLKLFSTVLVILVEKQGIGLRSQVSLKVQDYYFGFLLVQITLLVTLSAGLTAVVNEISAGGSVIATLGKNLPKASNYFIAYVLLQAFSASASALLRVDQLIAEYILSPIFDSTVSEKLARRKGLDIEWGCTVPIYTNLACIGLLYAVISPIILPFQLIIFFLFWMVYGESFVLKSAQSHGGNFYPKALKHLIIGLYTMELGLTLLFLLVSDSRGQLKCIGQACFMIGILCLTAVFHHVLNKTFNPLICSNPSSVPKLDISSQQDTAYQYLALDQTLTMYLPKDQNGISDAVIRETRKALGTIVDVQNTSASINAGSIKIIEN